MPDTHLRQQLDGLLDAAGAAFRSHDHAAAAAKLDEAVKLDPGHPGARLLQAKLLLHRDEPHEALAALDAIEQHAAARDPRPDVALVRFAALVSSGHREQAVDLLESLAVRLPNEPRVIEPLAGLYLDAGRKVDAATVLRRLVHLRPGDVRAARQLARVLETTDGQGAIRLLTAIHETARTADRPPLRLRLARLCRREGRLTEALEHYDALTADSPEGRPTEPRLWIEAGRVSDELGDVRGARQRLRRAVALGGPERHRAATALAVVEMHAGDLGKAAKMWRTVTVARDQTMAAKAWAGLLVCGEAAGRPRLATRAEIELDRRVSRADARRLLATLWQSASSGLAIVAAASDDQAKRIQPDAGSPLRTLLASAARTLERVRGDYPARADLQFHRAVAADCLGDRLLAMEAVTRAVEINPRYQAAKQLKTRLEGPDRVGERRDAA